MKLLIFALFFLLCTGAWAEDADSQPGKETESIAFKVFTFEDDTYALGLYDKVNWYQAELICRSQGFTLVSISSELKQHRIMDWITSEAFDYIPLLVDEPLWTSGTNQAVRDQYIWQSNGRSVNYNNFEVTPPTTTSRCLGINGSTGVWSHHNCRRRHYFLCEKLSEC